MMDNNKTIIEMDIYFRYVYNVRMTKNDTLKL